MPVCIYLFQIPCLKHSLPQRILRRLCSTTVRLLLAVYSIFQRLTPNKLYQPFQFKPFLRSRFEKRHWGLFFFLSLEFATNLEKQRQQQEADDVAQKRNRLAF